MAGPRKTELMRLQKLLLSLRDKNKEMCNSQEVNAHGMLQDRQEKVVKDAKTRQQQAATDLNIAAMAADKAIAADKKATMAYLNNKNKEDETWLEEELEAADKVTKAAGAKLRVERKELEEAEKELDKAQVELDRLYDIDAKYFAASQAVRKEADEVERQIEAIKKDLADNPSWGRKLKDLLKT